MDKTAPKLKRRVRHKKQPKWFTKKIEDFIKKRNLSKAEGDHLQHKYLRNQTKNLIRLTKKKYYGQVLRNDKGNSRQMWKQIKEVSGKEFTELNINNITKDGVHYYDVSEIVNLLNDYSNAANPDLCN